MMHCRVWWLQRGKARVVLKAIEMGVAVCVDRQWEPKVVFMQQTRYVKSSQWTVGKFKVQEVSKEDRLYLL
jgi:hypothetical protein